MCPDSHCRSVDPFLIVEPSAAGSYSKNMLTKYNLVLATTGIKGINRDLSNPPEYNSQNIYAGIYSSSIWIGCTSLSIFVNTVRYQRHLQ